MKDNPQWYKFALEYVTNGQNGKQAAIRAGYSPAPRSAEVRASELLRNVKVQEYIRQMKEDLASAYKDKIRDELAIPAFVSASDYIELDEDGNIRYKLEAVNNPIMSKAIKSIRPTQAGVELVFYDKQKALEQLARMIGVDAPREDNEAQGVRVVMDEAVEDWAE